MCSSCHDTCCRWTCRSQFLRPWIADALWWTPSSELLWSVSAPRWPFPALTDAIKSHHAASDRLRWYSAVTALTSAVMLAMRSAEMFPHRTLRRRSGFFWSLRLETRLRRRALYFTSVDLKFRKICGHDEQSRMTRLTNSRSMLPQLQLVFYSIVLFLYLTLEKPPKGQFRVSLGSNIFLFSTTSVTRLNWNSGSLSAL